MKLTYLDENDPTLLKIPVLGELSGGLVRFCCPYITYKLFEAKFDPLICSLTLDEAEELTDFLCARQPLCPECEWSKPDQLRQELALESFIRGDLERAAKHRALLKDTTWLDDMCWSCDNYAFPGVSASELRKRNDTPPDWGRRAPDANRARGAKVVNLFEYFKR